MATAPSFEVPANVDEVLKKTAQTYRRQLITMPTKGLGTSLKYMTLRPGIRVSETVSELDVNAEFGPYDENRKANANVGIKPRTLTVYLGNVALEFSPNSLYSTIWGSNTMQGEALKGVPIALQVLMLMAIKLGKNLNAALFNAVRNDSGTTSKELFNGFDTIAKTELDAANLSEDKGNLFKISDIAPDGIDDDNAIDVAQAICESADENLLDEDCLLFVPRKFMFAYNRAYLKRFGAVPYNRQYNKTFVEGFDNVSFAPLANKADSKFFQLTTRGNMLVGVNEGQNDSRETVNVEKYSSWKLTYEAVKFFGCQYESINKEKILFATIDGTTSMMAQKTSVTDEEEETEEETGLGG